MSGLDLPPVLGVTGGIGGLAMRHDTALGLADTYDVAGSELRGLAGLGAVTMADPDLLASAPFSPVTFAAAEVEVLRATTGGDGVLVASVGWELDALGIRQVVSALEQVDALVESSWDSLDYFVGFAVGRLARRAAVGLASGVAMTGPIGVATVAGVGLAGWALWQHARTTDRLGPLPSGDAVSDGFEEWLGDHPEFVEHAFNAGGGFLDGLGLPGFYPTTASAAAALAMAFRDGRHRLSRRDDLASGHGEQAPADVGDLMRHLDAVNALSPESATGRQGTIEVQRIEDRDGTRYVVYLPGTDDLHTLPWTQDGDLRDMGTNFRISSGMDDVYTRGIADAMHQAGIGPDDPVMLVGHSQGGMAAATMLADGSDFDVRQVVTAGSPTAYLDGFPTGSRVLSLENSADVIPLTDGAANRDSVEQVTVRFDDRETSLGGNHGLDHYIRGADAVDASDDPSVRHQLEQLRREGFLGARDDATVSADVYQLERVDDE